MINRACLYLVYNAPQGSGRYYLIDNSINKLITDVILHFNNVTSESCEFLTCGDFNARGGDRPVFVFMMLWKIWYQMIMFRTVAYQHIIYMRRLMKMESFHLISVDWHV